MKNKEEPAANSQRGNPSEQVDLNRSGGVGSETTGSLSRPGRTAAARAEQPALSLFPMSLMEAVVDQANLETAWKQVKANRGAPGPDGITITEFPDWFRSRWPTIRQQLLDGAYRPGPARRKAIDKPGGGQHDVLMARVSRRVDDKRLLRLIGRYLRAGVMVEGVLQPTDVGTPQGGPLSPLFSNILLDELDKELERRGLPFVRYADDFAVFAKSHRAAE